MHVFRSGFALVLCLLSVTWCWMVPSSCLPLCLLFLCVSFAAAGGAPAGGKCEINDTSRTKGFAKQSDQNAINFLPMSNSDLYRRLSPSISVALEKLEFPKIGDPDIVP